MSKDPQIPRPKNNTKRKKMSFGTFKKFLSREWLSEKDMPLLEDGNEYKSARESSDLESLESASGYSDANSDSQRRFKIDTRVVSDAIIGLSDGLTVPFALTAGLSALGNTNVVIYGGLAELFAGGISMGLGGFLGAKSEKESYRATLDETRNLLATSPSSISENISAIFEPYDLPTSTIDDLIVHLSQSPKAIDFLVRFEHMLPEPVKSHAITCALTIALSYFVGGFIPLLPYFFVTPDQVLYALYWSIGVMVVTLFIFGYVKTCSVVGWQGSRKIYQGAVEGLKVVLVGGIAAGAAMGIVKAFEGSKVAP
ncbi:MAG: hypothetical protein M1834_007334 [Cirrosporium novae-zelandiae]|nr:MAG: hypothetical protein M1834_007334 [Cirrosporium novae-zelandiae]